MHKFPQLNNLELNLDLDLEGDFLREALENNRPKLSTNVMIDYFRYLFNIRDLRVGKICLFDITGFVVKFLKEATDFEGALEIKYEETQGGEEAAFWGKLSVQDEEVQDPRLEVCNSDDSLFPNHDRKPTIQTTYFSNAELVTERFNTRERRGEKIMGHSRLMERLGDSLQHLLITDLNTKVEHLYELNDTEKLENIFNGNHLTSLLANCPNLISLTLKNSYLIVPTTTTSVLHQKLENLSIGTTEIDPKALTQLSSQLPSLKTLSLSQFSLPYRYTITHRKRLLEINMPNSSFDSNFCYDKAPSDTKDDSGNPIHSFYIQLVTEDEEYMQSYFYDDSTKSIKICEEDDYLFDGREHYLFDIRCKRLGQLWVQMDDKKYKKCVFANIH